MLSTCHQRFLSASDSPSIELSIDACDRRWIVVVSQRVYLFGLLTLMTVMLAGCGHKQVATVPAPAPVAAGSASQTAPNASKANRAPQSGQAENDAQDNIDAFETGDASWYGHPYHGRMAASGEIYDMEELTAAHRTLPFQTWVEVTNLNNGRKVQVRINDRGPFVDGRIIDLSHAAAREIDMLRAGVVPVELRIIEAPDAEVASIALPSDDRSSGDPPSGELAAGSATQPESGNNPSDAASSSGTGGQGYVVQAGAFAIRDGALRVRDRIASRLPDANARIVARDIAAGDGDSAILWRVLVGEGLSRPQAAQLAEQVSTISGEALVTSE